MQYFGEPHSSYLDARQASLVGERSPFTRSFYRFTACKQPFAEFKNFLAHHTSNNQKNMPKNFTNCNHVLMYMCDAVPTMEKRVLTIELQHHLHTTVIRCSGRIVYGDATEILRHTVMSQDKHNLEIDLGQVDAIDASGLGALVTLEKWARQNNVNLQLVNVPQRVLDAIEITRLTPVLLPLETVQDRDDAA